MNRATERVLKSVDSSIHELVSFLGELVRTPSVTGREISAQEVISDKLRDIGFVVDKWIPKKSDFRGFESFLTEGADFSSRPNVVGTLKGSRGARSGLAFNGHVDVVPPGDDGLWKYPPWAAKIVSGRLYGRGACDIKAGLAASIFALKALVDSDIPLEKDLYIHSVIGEESGGIGTLSTILRGYKPEATVICEPTNLNLLISQCGCLMFRIRVRGRAAHGASSYLGVSAVEKFQPILTGLIELERKRNSEKKSTLFASIPRPVTISVGTVRAGDWDSTVPEELVAEGRYGVWPGETLAHARKEFVEKIREVTKVDAWMRSHPPIVEWFGPQWESCEIPLNHWLVQMVSASYRDTFRKLAPVGGEQAGTDMRLYTSICKSPAVLIGPGDLRVAHFRDEYVPIKDVIRACKLYAVTALKYENTSF